jgi:hypothetical protein
VGKEGDGAAKLPNARTRGAIGQVAMGVGTVPDAMWTLGRFRVSAWPAVGQRQAPTFAHVAAEGRGGRSVALTSGSGLSRDLGN